MRTFVNLNHLFNLTDTDLQADITAMIARKNAINPNNVTNSQAFNRRVELTQKRHLAAKRQDYKEVAEIDKELESLAALQPSVTGRKERSNPQADLMAKVNERNRRANLEVVRKAEAELAARKRQERKALANVASTGTASPAPLEISARAKVSKTHNDSGFVIQTINNTSSSLSNIEMQIFNSPRNATTEN